MMKLLKLTISVVLATMATCQPHGEFLSPAVGDTAVPMPSSSGVPVITESGSTAVPMTPDMSSSAAMMTDTTMAPVITSQAGSTMTPDVTTPAAVTSMGTDAPTTTPMPTTTAAPNYYPSIDEIIAAFKAIAQSEYFMGLSYDEQMLVLELTSGGEVGKIKEVMDNIGYERLFSFVYKIPLRYLDNLMQFILAGLERENLLQAANAS